MANTDAPRGLRPVQYMNGAPWNGQARRYYVPASDSTGDIYIGQLVKPGGSADADGVPSVAVNITTGDDVLGVVVGIDPVFGAGADGRSSTLYRADDTERYLWVVDDPNVLFGVQDDAASTLTAAAVYSVADLTGLNAGSTTTGFSSTEISAASVTASGDNTEDVMIMGIVNKPDNTIGDNCEWLVRLNQHFYRVNLSAGA
jgi:hypothetical protein